MESIIICDDNLLEAKKSKEILENYIAEKKLSYEVKIENNGQDFLSLCKEGSLVPDLIFMDVELGEKTGIEIVAELNKILPQCFVIYLSNYLEYSLDVYSTEHQYFILKSQLANRLDEVFGKIDSLNKQKNQMLKVELKYNQVINVAVNDICCLERKGRKTFVVTEQATYETYQHINDLSALLNDNFVRCHNSYVVNMRKIVSYKRERILLQTDIEIPISRQYQPVVKETFMNWSKRNLM